MTTEEHRELDAQVAEEVMGFSWRGSKQRGEQGEEQYSVLLPANSKLNRGFSAKLSSDNTRFHDWDRYLPHYSTEIADAWEVVNVIESRGYNVKYQTSGARHVGPRVTIDESGHTQHGAAEDESAPIAICRAALQAVRSEEAQAA